MTFYRFHWADCPEFSAGNAYSALWGAERNEDGTKTRCADCNGQGRLFADDPDCETCDGSGWEDAVEGYSACDTAADLLAYFAERGSPSAGQVVIFEGRRTGTGPDGEPLVIPTRVIDTVPWSTFAAKAA